MHPSQKTRFRLHLELFAGMVVLLPAILLMGFHHEFIGLALIVITGPFVLVASRQVKERREPFTPRQKEILFGLEVAADVIMILGLLAIALLRQTQLAWQVFGVVSVGVLAAMVWSRRRIYTDPVADPSESTTTVQNDEIQSPNGPVM
jgi:hypothetical protein